MWPSAWQSMTHSAYLCCTYLYLCISIRQLLSFGASRGLEVVRSLRRLCYCALLWCLIVVSTKLLFFLTVVAMSNTPTISAIHNQCEQDLGTRYLSRKSRGCGTRPCSHVLLPRVCCIFNITSKTVGGLFLPTFGVFRAAGDKVTAWGLLSYTELLYQLQHRHIRFCQYCIVTT